MRRHPANAAAATMFALKRSISLSHDKRREHPCGARFPRNRPEGTVLECRRAILIAARRCRRRSCSGPLPGLADGWRAAGEALVHLAVRRPLRIAALAIRRKDATPEGDSAGVTLIFDDFPVAGESIEYKLGRIAADPQASVRLADEK